MVFELNDNTYRFLIVVFLLVILGLVSFNAYMFVSAKDKVAFGLGIGAGLQFPFRQKKTGNPHEPILKRRGIPPRSRIPPGVFHPDISGR